MAIKTKTKTELAQLYGMSRKTMMALILKLDSVFFEEIKNCKILFPESLEKLYKILGDPTKENNLYAQNMQRFSEKMGCSVKTVKRRLKKTTFQKVLMLDEVVNLEG